MYDVVLSSLDPRRARLHCHGLHLRELGLHDTGRGGSAGLGLTGGARVEAAEPWAAVGGGHGCSRAGKKGIGRAVRIE